ncbi:hypothetical protein HK098_007951 [Nowakowskiella sp. JEL0407]|nr:hypothetical protein HK098_007951 [Nowakowskiella sp. JEL0407]
MSSQTCARCSKPAYPTEKIETDNLVFHKKHVPQPTATSISDPLSIVHAKHVPKKSIEGLNKIVVGTGEVPTYGLDSIATQHALGAPRKSMENLGTVHKGASVKAAATTPRSATKPEPGVAKDSNDSDEFDEAHDLSPEQVEELLSI